MPAAIGSDTGGSVRIPPALCGLTGLKTTYGLISLYGAVPLSSTLDTIGPLAHTAEDAALLTAAMAGPDPRDPATHDAPPFDLDMALADPSGVRGVRITALPVDQFPSIVCADALAARSAMMAALSDLGARVEEARVPLDFDEVMLRNGRIIAAEAYAVHRAYIEDPALPIDPWVRKRMVSGKAISAADYIDELAASAARGRGVHNLDARSRRAPDADAADRRGPARRRRREHDAARELHSCGELSRRLRAVVAGGPGHRGLAVRRATDRRAVRRCKAAAHRPRRATAQHRGTCSGPSSEAGVGLAGRPTGAGARHSISATRLILFIVKKTAIFCFATCIALAACSCLNGIATAALVRGRSETGGRIPHSRSVAAAHAEDADVAWRKRETWMQRSAKAENKPVFLYWGAVWCPPCNQVKATIFNRQDFIERSRFFVPVYLDGDSKSAQKQGARFRVGGYPTMILFTPDGTEITRLPGEVDAEQYMRVLAMGMNGARPVKATLAAALAARPGAGDPKLSAEDWRMLAYYSWDTDEQTLVPDKDVPATLSRLARACPADQSATATRLA